MNKNLPLYIPHNLDIQKLVAENPSKFQNFKMDKLCYILHLINHIPAHNKDLQYSDFTPIHKETLKKQIQNYNLYINYLLNDLKIVETDGYYIVKKKCTGLRFVKEYDTFLLKINVKDFTFNNSLKRNDQRKSLKKGELTHLSKHFNHKLKIDSEFVDQFLSYEYQLVVGNEHLWEKKNSYEDGKIVEHTKDPKTQCKFSRLSVDKIVEGDYHLMRDNNVNRFHSNLTSMRTVLRNALTYDGKILKSLDVKNSQPYLSSIFFNPLFWRSFLSDENKKLIHENLKENHQKQLKKKPISKAKASRAEEDRNILNNIISKSNNINILEIFNILSKDEVNIYIMMGDIAEALANKDFCKYIDSVVNGTLYDELKKEFGVKLGKYYVDRKDVKAAVFQVMFTDNRFIGQEEAAPKRIFKELFPDIYSVFNAIKRKDSTLLPRILQRIESYLMIDVISKRFANEYPEAPIFLIHDSLATTDEFIKDAKRIMEEEFTKAIGHPPKIAMETWSKENMIQHIEMLKYRAQQRA